MKQFKTKVTLNEYTFFYKKHLIFKNINASEYGSWLT